MTSTSTSSVLQTAVTYARPFNSHNYKGFYSVVFMAFVDADCKFIWADIGDMWSAWNARIYSASGLKNALKMVIQASPMLILFPNFPKTTRMCPNSSDFNMYAMRMLSMRPVYDHCASSTLYICCELAVASPKYGQKLGAQWRITNFIARLVHPVCMNLVWPGLKVPNFLEIWLIKKLLKQFQLLVN